MRYMEICYSGKTVWVQQTAHHMEQLCRSGFCICNDGKKIEKALSSPQLHKKNKQTLPGEESLEWDLTPPQNSASLLLPPS